MPFNDLIINGLKHETSHSEQNKKISLRPRSGEIILFFEIDNSNCITRDKIIDFKNKVRPTEKGAVCDLLIVYSNKDLGKKLFLLVDLKGDTKEQVKKGIGQISTTYEYLKHELRTKLGTNIQIDWVGIILSHGSSPKNYKRYLRNSPVQIMLISKQNADDKCVRSTIKNIYSYIES